MRPRSHWIAALTLVPAFLAACSETPPTGVEPTTSGPLLQISDAVNSAGRAGFYFLPPLVPDPGPFTGTFDANLAPEVRVCQLVASACGATIKTFTATTAEPVEVSVPRQTYGVNWTTKNNPAGLTTAAKYRIEIRVGTQLLGFADLAFVKSSKNVASIPAGTIAAVLGSPLNIKFRIETATVGSITITPPAASIALPGDQTFSAEVRTLQGVVVPNASVAWASTNTAAATVSPTSGSSTQATGVAAGNAVITATFGGVTASAELAVMRKPIAEDDSYSGTAGQLLSPGATPALPTLLANDDAGSPAGTITSVWVDGFEHPIPMQNGGIPFAGGLLQLWPDGNFSVSTTTVGQYSFRYTLTNAAGSDVAAVSVAMGVGSPTAMTALSDADQTATAGTAVAEPPSVRVTDTWGNPVAGVTVTFTAAPVGSVTGSPATTDANGVATAGSWTLGTIVGDMPERVQTVTATAGTLSQTFTGRAVAGSAVSITLAPLQAVIQPGQRQIFTAIVHDMHGNPLYTRPAIQWSSSDPSVAIMDRAVSQSSEGSASATAAAIANRDPLEGTTLIRASLNASLFTHAQLRVKSLTPFAFDDEFTVRQKCEFLLGICLFAQPIELTGNVFLENHGPADLLGEPAGVVDRFGVFDSEAGAFQWFAAGETASLGTIDGSVKLESDGKLTYTRPTGPLVATTISVAYELKNTLGTSTATVRIDVLTP